MRHNGSVPLPLAGESLRVRRAEIRDMKAVFDLSNDHVVRAMSIHPKIIEWGGHVKWFEKMLTSSGVDFYVLEVSDTFAGYAHLDAVKDAWDVTIHLDPEFRGQGLGGKFLDYVVLRNPEKTLRSYVKPENAASRRLFESRGFSFVRRETIDGVLLDCLLLKERSRKFVVAVSNALYDKTELFAKKDAFYIRSRDELTVETLKRINPEYVFFPHWSFIIPPQIYETFNCVVFHMTDLPFGRGGSPLQNLISRGVYKTKISAIRCSKTLDGGDVYLKRDFDISHGSAAEIYSRAGEIVSRMIDEIVEKRPRPCPQKGEIVEFKRRTPEESDIGGLQEVRAIYDYIRMLDADGYPHAFLRNESIRFEFRGAKLEGEEVLATVRIRKET